MNRPEISRFLVDKCAVVTGGGRGIGREVALALSRQGASVVVNDLGTEIGGKGADPSPANEVVAEIVNSGGVAKASYASVADFTAAKHIIDSCVQEYGRIDILVNCAAIAKPGQLWETSEEDSAAVLAVTLKGTLNTCHHAILAMMKQNSGRIINFTSPSWLGVTGGDAYTAAKGGVVSLTRGIANRMKLDGFKITCNAVAPIARTRLTRVGDSSIWEKSYRAGIIDRQIYEDSIDPPDPKEIPPIVLYLSSDKAENITGRVFGASRGRIALYSEPQEIKGMYKEGVWTLEELVKLIPKTLARGL